MRLIEVLAVIDTALEFEIANVKETYDSKFAIPEKRMDFIVRSIQPANKGLLIILDEPQKTMTLEELGYNFEAGM